MKFNGLCLLVMLTSVTHAFATECQTSSNGTKLCVNDKVWFFNTISTNDSFLGTITEASTPMSVTLNDGTVVKKYVSELKNQNSLQNCAKVNKRQICNGDLISIYNYSFKQLEVIGFDKHVGYSDIKLGVLGKSLEGTKVHFLRTDTILLDEGNVQGFPSVKYGEAIPNSFGSVDKILGYNPSRQEYVIQLGDETRVANKKQIGQRLNRVNEFTLSLVETFKNNDYRINPETQVGEPLSEREYKALLEKEARLNLLRACNDSLLTEKPEVTDVIINSSGKITKEYLKYVGGGHGVGLDIPSVKPRIVYKAKYKITGTCR